jgi:hypothetical protein
MGPTNTLEQNGGATPRGFHDTVQDFGDLEVGIDLDFDPA